MVESATWKLGAKLVESGAKLDTNRHKDLTASEQTIFKEFLANNLETRLYNKFVVDVTKP